jgi:heme-degrading monooxygenase HmoA
MQQRYARYLRDVAAPHILATPGIKEVQIFEPFGSQDEFLVKSVWADVASLTAFAGSDWSKPQVLATELEMIASARVSHHRVGARYDTATVTISSRVRVDSASGIAEIDGDVFKLPPTEMRLLTELVQRAGRQVDSLELARAVWRGSAAVNPGDVRRSIYRLRRLIDDHNRPSPVIRSRRGYGYVIDGDM